MDKTEQITKRVEKTIGLLDQMDNLEAGADFYTNIRRKIHENEKIKTAGSFNFLRNLKLQPILMAAILMVNIFSTLFFILGSGSTIQNDDQYQEYASLILEANTIESNTYGENMVTNFTAEVE